MSQDRLHFLSLTPFPPSPPTYGAQRRVHGLLAALGRDHDITAVALVPPDLDAAQAEAEMRRYCREVILLPARPWRGISKRFLQVRALISRESYERLAFEVPGLHARIGALLAERDFDVALVEFPFLAHHVLQDVPVGRRRPLRILDEHNIEFDLARQQAAADHGLGRRIHNAVNWPKLQREELDAFRRCDGVVFCSEADQARARSLSPDLRSDVVPNAVDIEDFRPSPTLPPSDGCTVMFFGAINYFPNVDGLAYLLHEIWPLLARSHPRAKLKIVGQHPTPEVLAFRGPRVEVTGKVDDLRPHLSSAAVTVVPLRIGGGTRFKILEAMSMARPVVSTSLGAEGIDVPPEGPAVLLADDPAAFAAAVGRVLDDPQLGTTLGARGRALVEQRYSWTSAARTLTGFVQALRRA